MMSVMDDDGRLGDFIEGEQNRTRNIDNRPAPDHTNDQMRKIKKKI